MKRTNIEEATTHDEGRMTKHRGTVLRRLQALFMLCAWVLLSGCTDADWDAFFYTAELWAEARGIWDGENLDYQRLGAELAGDTVDQITGGPEQTGLEANEVVDDIRQADAYAEQAQREVMVGDPSGALVFANQAIQQRPNDYSYVQNRAVIYLASGDIAAYHQDIMDAQKIMEGQIKRGQDCRTAHRIFYDQQLAALQAQQDQMPSHAAIQEQISDVQLSVDHPEDWACE